MTEDKQKEISSSSSSIKKDNNDNEEIKTEIIPITLNVDNEKFEINDNNEVNTNPLESIKEIDESEDSDIMSYSSDDEKEVKKTIEEENMENKSTIEKKSESEISIPKVKIIKTESISDDKSDQPLTPSPDTDIEENIEEGIEENIEEEYLTDDFEEDEEVEIKVISQNKEETDSKTEPNNNSTEQNKDNNNNSIELIIESATFKNDPKVQDMLKDVKECFIAYEFLNYEPQDLTSDYSVLNDNKMIFHFSKGNVSQKEYI